MFRKLAILVRALWVLWRFPLRCSLTVLSAALGVSGALTSIDYALGGRVKVTDQLSRLGTNLLIITPNQSRNVGGRARTGAQVTTLTLGDYIAVRREVPFISKSSAFVVRNYPIKAGNLAKKGCAVVGIEPEYMSIKKWTLREGTGFTPVNLRRMARVAIVGVGVARDLFGDTSPEGQRLLINRVPFEVIGVMAERGQSLDAANEDDQVYVPLTTAMHRLASLDYLSGILFAIDGWDKMDEAARATAAAVGVRHGRAGNTPLDFRVQNQKELLETQLDASAKLLFFVRWIGLSALCVSGLGILAISWIGVRERTREIGTRRALGATRADIFLQIVWESCALSGCGCITGALLALGSSIVLTHWMSQPQVFDKPSAWLAIAVALILNAGFAGLPARNAALLDPIQALRFE